MNPAFVPAAIGFAVLLVLTARVEYALGVCDMARDLRHLAGPYTTCVVAVFQQGDDE